jgi:hypothetical protein
MINNDIIIKLKTIAIKKCQDRVNESKNNKKEIVLDHKEFTIASKLKKMHGL